MSVFDNIKKYSKNRGMNLQQVAVAAGLSKNVIYQYNKGKSPSIDTLKKIASVLGVSAETLLGNQDESKTTTNNEAKKVNIEELLDGTAMLTDRDGELTDSDRAALRALISTYLQSTEGRERLKKYSNMELDDNGGNGDD
ncbi:XRE family transcriptional regulator [Levilactobacillus brevis]|jgi:transcriptional regulator with XRE-family HTH domain|uniref:helix-turn-helix domain-containing protein n=1 Tax=Levilactobacillus brevis TaxID=1580 RepID=UPI00155E0B3A|nr:helix-turn-helix transcriptional regulator [Levilactobacillus brevis]MCS8597017.1 XRE family transcriptional regulator [Levilactobacillus brevis]NRD29449.1 helix-turn-helix domain-containing protein [Levilactobacillus brevis]